MDRGVTVSGLPRTNMVILAEKMASVNVVAEALLREILCYN